MLRALALATLLVAPAHADPRFALGLDYGIGAGGHVEAFDLGMRIEAGLFLRVGAWQLTSAFATHPRVRSHEPARDSPELGDYAFVNRLAYRIPLDGATLSVGGGIARHWLIANSDVTRSCRQTAACVAGTYRERPAYDAWAPQLRLSIGRDQVWPTFVLGASFDVIVEALALPPQGGGLAVMAGATFQVGGGPRR